MSSNKPNLAAEVAGLRQNLSHLAAAIACLTGEVARVHARLDEWKDIIESAAPVPLIDPSEQTVSLDQIAAIMHRKKRSFDRYRKEMPEPIEGGGSGRATRWRWSDVRPWLEKKFGVILPESFPGMG